MAVLWDRMHLCLSNIYTLLNKLRFPPKHNSAYIKTIFLAIILDSRRFKRMLILGIHAYLIGFSSVPFIILRTSTPPRLVSACFHNMRSPDLTMYDFFSVEITKYIVLDYEHFRYTLQYRRNRCFHSNNIFLSCCLRLQ